MSRNRGPNIAKTLVKNSRDAMIIALEIHNKPICMYRLSVVVILLIHSWELLLKAYCYKYLKDKNVMELNDETNKYRNFSSILDQIFHTNPTNFRILYENLGAINDWRNEIIHGSPHENLDELIYQFITKSILIYKKFISDFFPKDNLDVLEDMPILPIIFKLPFSVSDLLTNTAATKNASKEVIAFLSKVQARTKKLAEDGIEEMIYVSIKTEFTSEKNGDLVAKIEKNHEDAIIFKKDSTFRLTNDPSAQTVRITSFTEKQKEDLFPIRSGLMLKSIVKTKLQEKQNKINWSDGIYSKQLKELKGDNENTEWMVDTKNLYRHRYSEKFLNLLIESYIRIIK